MDQTSERILFEVGPNTVTMTTQISFAGDSEDFAWILPLPEVPDVDSLATFSQRALAALDARTGPVVESEDPDQLTEWLRTEGYRVTPPMEPYIKLYTDEGMKFLALKLLEAADVSDITPFRFTLPGTTPSVPLRITSIAAEPEMSILVFVLSDQRFEEKAGKISRSPTTRSNSTEAGGGRTVGRERRRRLGRSA